MSDDCWDAFGSDDDSAEEEEKEKDEKDLITKSQGILFLTQAFVKSNPKRSLSHRFVFVSTLDEAWKQGILQRGMSIAVDEGPCDAMILLEKGKTSDDVVNSVVPGGYVLISSPDIYNFDTAVWSSPESVHEDKLWVVQKHKCCVNSTSCPWKPHTAAAIQRELHLLGQATVARTAHDLRNKSPLNETDISKAVQNIHNFGYCIIRSVIDEDLALQWGAAVLDDFHEASKLLLQRDEIDLYHPHDSKFDPQTYRELSMREDLRMDLRDGPRIRRMRQQEQKLSGIAFTVPDHELHNPTQMRAPPPNPVDSCLRYHPQLLTVVQRAMNPSDEDLCYGNFGRYNFSGSGPDGSPQEIRVGPQGGIISLPGSADQAIHADTPHLFETFDCLPPHYINAFCLGTRDTERKATGATPVGGTAFVHSSHRLSFTSSLQQDWKATTEPKVLQNLVRPSLELGDLILFDCRILHFGISNTSQKTERVLLYTNMTQAWFHDPKNWDNRQWIFNLG